MAHTPRRRLLVPAVAAAVLGICGCGQEPPAGPHPSTVGSSGGPGAVMPPPEGAAFDYQLGGAYDPPPGTGVVVRDSTEVPAPGIYSVCYINAFQTQPEASWPQDLLLRNGSGAPVVDPAWPDERLLDISTAGKRTAVARRHVATVGDCAAAGYRAVEFDNLDSYTRSGGRLGLDDAVALAGLLVAAAHERGLAAGQKNTAELGERGRDEIGYDFAVTEECDRWQECDNFTAVYDEQVLNVEYADDLRGTPEQVCARISTPVSTVVRDRGLLTPAEPGHVHHSC